MRKVERYKWRIQWLGKWTTTRHLATEEDVKKEHPEAIRIEGTLDVIEVPETKAEADAMAANNSTSSWLRAK